MTRAIERHIILLLMLLFGGQGILYSQEPDVYAIIDSVKLKLETIEDYKADIEVKVDVDFINMPDKKASILFKKPDKVKFISDDFLMLPKRGLGRQMTDILQDPFTAIYIGMDSLDNEYQHIIRIVPMGRKPEVILATWWINARTFQLVKNESSLKKGGNFTVALSYKNESSILPKEMIFSFEVEKISIPLKFIGKANGVLTDSSKKNGSSQGTVYIRFTNYEINTGLEDKMFN
jgi:hypothetical protein